MTGLHEITKIHEDTTLLFCTKNDFVLFVSS